MSEAVENNKMDVKVDYHALEMQRADALQLQFKKQLRSLELGKQASLRRVVLGFVIEGHYTEAATTIDEFMRLKKIYQSAVERSSVYVNHAKELINAIRTKRNFPQLSLLSISKQQEILDHAIGHFEELKITLKAIENLIRDESIKDIRSTVWVLRTVVYTVVIVVVTSFLTEFTSKLGQPLWIIFNDFADISFNFLLKMMPFI